MPEQLAPLVTRLMSGNPWSMIRWLRQSRAAEHLVWVAKQEGPINHELLDRLPQDINTAYARELLIAAGILPSRNEPLAQLQLWTERTVEQLSAYLTPIIRPFAEWDVIRDARNRARRGPYTQGAAIADRDVIRTAIMFLQWLEKRHVTLEECTQHQLDHWLTVNPTRRNQIGSFLRWINARGLAKMRLDIPKRPSGQPAQFLTSDDHLQQIKRCLNDDHLPLDLRVIAALTRLYAIPISRIVEFTTNQYLRDGGNSYLTIKTNPVLLPPKLAALIEEVIAQLSAPSGQPPDRQNYLFPGQPPSRPRSITAVRQQLTSHDLPSIPARNTAMLEAVTNLPNVVISDLLGVHPSTAARWARLAQGNWADYIKAREI